MGRQIIFIYLYKLSENVHKQIFWILISFSSIIAWVEEKCMLSIYG